MSKKRKFFRNSWIITLAGGVALGIFGITKIVEASNMDVPQMGDSGWFDASTSQMNVQTAGIILCVIGFLFVALMGSLILYFFSRQTPEDMAKAKAKMIDKQKRYKAELERLGIDEEFCEAKNESATQAKFCKYCGANLNGKDECSSCGAKNN